MLFPKLSLSISLALAGPAALSQKPVEPHKEDKIQCNALFAQLIEDEKRTAMYIARANNHSDSIERLRSALLAGHYVDARSMNMTMILNDCPSKKIGPLRLDAYDAAASKCVIAKQTNAASAKQACDEGSWQR